MKYTKILRILSLAVILSLLFVLLPITPAYAQRTITATPTTGPIGTRVRVLGTGFSPSTDTTYRYAVLFFSNQSATTLNDIDTTVTVYEKVADAIYVDTSGNFDVNFPVPSVMNDGASTGNVTSGTYYFYACIYDTATPPNLIKRITAIASFTVTAGTVTLTPNKGQVGSDLRITGANFVASQAITFKWDTTNVAVKSGDSRTTSAGAFNTTITVPETPSGAHTVSATVSDYEVTATFTVEPKATFSATSGDADATVTIKGTGFTRRKEVSIYFSAKSLVTATTDANGSFTAEFKVPKMNPGSYDLEVDDNAGNLVAIKFRITGTAPPTTPPPPTPTTPPAAVTVNVNPTKGFVGSEVVVGGVGFKEGATISVKWDDKEVASAKGGTQGIFIATFRVPPGKSGDHTITITDGTKTEKLTFKVETTVPPTPQPLLPEMGVELKELLTFDWKDVTTDNPPITYTLQIASSQDFSAGSLLIEKKGLTKSEYTPTKEETAKLAGRQAPYYWRVRAVDAAENEGNWTGAGQFYVPKPFTLPPWSKWALIGVGGVVLLLIGYWFGRRSAYYY